MMVVNAVEILDPIINRINTITKFPSIPAFHERDGGRFTDRVIPPIEKAIESGDGCFVTEKVDGSNIRIILFPDNDWILESAGYPSWLIGTRNKIVASSTSPVINDSGEAIISLLGESPLITNVSNERNTAMAVIYAELYGGKIQGGSKIYGGDRLGLRVFATQKFSMDNVKRLLAKPVRDVVEWRENWARNLIRFVGDVQNDIQVSLPTVPVLGTCENATKELPLGVRGIYEFARGFFPSGDGGEPMSKSKLGDGGKLVPEGVVLWDRYSRWVTKIRFDDYRKELRKRGDL